MILQKTLRDIIDIILKHYTEMESEDYQQRTLSIMGKYCPTFGQCTFKVSTETKKIVRNIEKMSVKKKSVRF